MQTLSIRQPWADLIVHGVKPLENRTWKSFFRGAILVHAGKRFDDDGLPFIADLIDAHYDPAGRSILRDIVRRARDDARRGALMGSVEIKGCVESSDDPWFVGPFAMVLRRPVLFRHPIPGPGRLGFFDVPDTHVRDAMRAAETFEPPARCAYVHQD